MATRKSYITPPVDADSLKGSPISDDEPFEGAGLVFSEGEWKPAAGGAGGGASVSASYVVLTSNPGLTAERVLTAGSGIAITDNGANNTVVIEATGEATGADYAASFVVMGLTSSLPNERALTAGTGIKLTDGGAGGNVTLAANDSVLATISGSTFSGATLHTAGLSGSLTKLTDGRSYLVAGDNVTITSQSNGQVTISAAAGGGGGGGDVNATYLVLSATASLNNERVITAGTGIKATDAGAGGAYTLSVHDGTFAALTGSIFTGPVSASSGLSGSLQRIGPNLAYLNGLGAVTVSTGANGQVSVSASIGAPINASYLALAADGVLTAERVFTPSTGLKATDAGAGGAYTLIVHDGTFAALSGANFTGPISAQVTGSLTVTAGGTPFITAPAGNVITVTTGANGQIILSGSGGTGGGSGAPIGVQYLVLAADGTLTAERVFTAGAGIKTVDGGPGAAYTVSVHDGTFAALSGANFTGAITAAAAGGITGSITRTTAGTPFITAPAGNIISISTGSNGQIILSGTGDGAGTSGAPSNADYLVLNLNPFLTNERALTMGTGLKGADAGTNDVYTISVHDGTFAALSGANFTGNVAFAANATFNGALTGSLTKLVSGAPFITALPNNIISITTSSDGQIIFSGSGGAQGPPGAAPPGFDDISPNLISKDAYGRLEFILSSTLGCVGTVTAIACKTGSISHSGSPALTVDTAAHWFLNPTTLTASMAVTASTAGCVPRDHMSIYIFDTNYTLTVANGGGAAGTIFSSSIGGTVRRAVWDLVYDGANWVLGSVTRLA